MKKLGLIFLMVFSYGYCVLASCATDDRTIFEVMTDKRSTIFLCKVMETEKRNSNDIISKVKVLEVLVGEIDTSYIEVGTGNTSSSGRYVYMNVGKEFLIYSRKYTHLPRKFGAFGCDLRSKMVSDSESFNREIKLLRDFRAAYINSNNKKTKVKFHHPNGNIAFKARWKNKKMHGKWEHYNKDGRLRLSENYKNGKLDGKYKFRLGTGGMNRKYKNGRLVWSKGFNKKIPTREIREKSVLNGRLQKVKEYYKGSGVLKKEYQVEILNFSFGYFSDQGKGKIPVGKYATYYPSGMVEEIGEYQEGAKIGYWRKYTESGQLIEETFFDPKFSDEKNFVRYYVTGEIAFQGDIKNGKKEGRWIGKTIKGDLSYDGVFQNDKKNGSWKYYGSGILWREGNYKDNKKEGEWVFYFHDGSGVVEKGKYIANNKEGLWQQFHKPNILKSEGNYLTSQRVGKWKNYYETGELVSTGTYLNSKQKDGDWQSFFKNGKIRGLQFYDDGWKINTWKKYNEFGKLVMETEYQKGRAEPIKQKWHKEDGTIQEWN